MGPLRSSPAAMRSLVLFAAVLFLIGAIATHAHLAFERHLDAESLEVADAHHDDHDHDADHEHEDDDHAPHAASDHGPLAGRAPTSPRVVELAPLFFACADLAIILDPSPTTVDVVRPGGDPVLPPDPRVAPLSPRAPPLG